MAKGPTSGLVTVTTVAVNPEVAPVTVSPTVNPEPVSFSSNNKSPFAEVLLKAKALLVINAPVENYSKCRIRFFLILAISTNFFPTKINLSDNTVRLEASGFLKLSKLAVLGIFKKWTFVHLKL